MHIVGALCKSELSIKEEKKRRERRRRRRGTGVSVLCSFLSRRVRVTGMGFRGERSMWELSECSWSEAAPHLSLMRSTMWSPQLLAQSGSLGPAVWNVDPAAVAKLPGDPGHPTPATCQTINGGRNPDISEQTVRRVMAALLFARRSGITHLPLQATALC